MPKYYSAKTGKTTYVPKASTSSAPAPTTKTVKSVSAKTGKTTYHQVSVGTPKTEAQKALEFARVEQGLPAETVSKSVSGKTGITTYKVPSKPAPPTNIQTESIKSNVPLKTPFGTINVPSSYYNKVATMSEFKKIASGAGKTAATGASKAITDYKAKNIKAFGEKYKGTGTGTKKIVEGIKAKIDPVIKVIAPYVAPKYAEYEKVPSPFDALSKEEKSTIAKDVGTFTSFKGAHV